MDLLAMQEGRLLSLFLGTGLLIVGGATFVWSQRVWQRHTWGERVLLLLLAAILLSVGLMLLGVANYLEPDGPYSAREGPGLFMQGGGLQMPICKTSRIGFDSHERAPGRRMPSLPARIRFPHQAQIGLVDQGRRLSRLPRAQSVDERRGQLPELVVDRR
jgi:hypothetical protein